VTTLDQQAPIVFVREEVHDMLAAEPAPLTAAQIRGLLAGAQQAINQRHDSTAAAQPIYMVPDNPWLPWANRTGGLTMGAWLGAAITLLLDSPLLLWALASAIAVTCLFAWVIAGHELYERYPKKFKPVQ
jgi:hypothetical protein